MTGVRPAHNDEWQKQKERSRCGLLHAALGDATDANAKQRLYRTENCTKQDGAWRRRLEEEAHGHGSVVGSHTHTSHTTSSTGLAPRTALSVCVYVACICIL
jgi:hypothetical protein